MTDGRIAFSDVVIDPQSGTSDDRSWYSTDIRYEYIVSGETFTGSRISFADASSQDLRSIQGVTHRYPVGGEVTVHYDPVDISSSVLEPGLHGGNAVPLILGPALIGFGLLIATVGMNGPDAIFKFLDEGTMWTVLPIGGFVAGLGALLLGIRTSLRARASRSWPRERGIVVSSEVRRGRSSSGSSGRTTSTYLYRPAIVFEYTIADRRYISDSISFADYSSSNSGHAEEIVARYPRGAEVEVYYNPQDPSTAVLERRAGGGGCIFFVVGMMFVVISALFFFVFRDIATAP